jgi:hypothetical protein
MRAYFDALVGLDDAVSIDLPYLVQWNRSNCQSEAASKLTIDNFRNLPKPDILPQRKLTK